MEKNLKTLIVLIVVSTISVFFIHRVIISDQENEYSDDKRYVDMPLEYDNSPYPIQNLDRETLLKFLNERIVYFEAVEDIKEKIYINEMILRVEITKDKPDKKIIAKLTKERSDLYRNLNKITYTHKVKLKEILNVGSNGFIGRGLIYRTIFWH